MFLRGVDAPVHTMDCALSSYKLHFKNYLQFSSYFYSLIAFPFLKVAVEGYYRKQRCFHLVPCKALLDFYYLPK